MNEFFAGLKPKYLHITFFFFFHLDGSSMLNCPQATQVLIVEGTAQKILELCLLDLTCRINCWTPLSLEKCPFLCNTSSN